MSGVDVYGPLVSASDVEEGVIAHLRLWLPAYLREVDRRYDIEEPGLPSIRSYSTVNEFKKWPEEQIPAVIVISPGTDGEPKREGDGTYRTKWTVGTAVVVSARDQASTNRIAKLYGLAVRAAILQHQKLGELNAESVEWNAERYDNVRRESNRTIAAANLIFGVQIRGTINSLAGPIVPPPDPSADPELDTITDADTTVTLKED